MSTTRRRDRGDDGDRSRSPKRARLSEEPVVLEDVEIVEAHPLDTEQDYANLLPPSHALLGLPAPVGSPEGSMFRIMESDVGISEYVGHDVPKIEGIIKQRFTDFLVFEVDLDGNVIHVKKLGKPESSKKKDKDGTIADGVPANVVEPVETPSGPAAEPAAEESNSSTNEAKNAPIESLQPQEETGPWPERFTTTLKKFLSDEAVESVKALYLEGPEPPFVSDSGWGGRQSKVSDNNGEGASTTPPEPEPESSKPERGKRGRDRGGRGTRGGRGGRPGRPGEREDPRKVLSNPIASKETRTGLHQAIRELFAGKLESETDTSSPATDDGSRIAIRWSKRGGGGRGGRGGGRAERGRGARGERGDYPPYIHFTLQKTNRDTQDALSHLSRSLRCNVKDLSVAGTKDKRGVTTQRVALRRGNKTVEDVWRLANGLSGRRTAEEALTKRGERGIRIADFNYRRAGLELGMLKGNAFVITLRNVQVDSSDTIERALSIVKEKGFINYYGMQRFGTASVPTHSIGLAILKSDWQKAIALILCVRPGEHPEVVAARKAWLEDGDLDTALELMPRRVVAERCILESYKKQGGDTRNAMGSLSTIPRNLRLMYVHAYQSYVWNAIVSERIRMFGADKPAIGDLVFETNEDAEETEVVVQGAEDVALVEDKTVPEDKSDNDDTQPGKQNRRRKPWEPQRVKALTEADLDKYTIFDVAMPLPGKDVSYPEGKLGERYKEFLRADGLDPDNWIRKQKEYSLGGSYRKIMHLPSELSWSVLRYTDPDVALAQADEDKLLGFDPPKIDDSGKFMALQIQLQLGTAAYATMALREITKTETSSHYQTALTIKSDDQKFKGKEVDEDD